MSEEPTYLKEALRAQAFYPTPTISRRAAWLAFWKLIRQIDAFNVPFDFCREEHAELQPGEFEHMLRPVGRWGARYTIKGTTYCSIPRFDIVDYVDMIRTGPPPDPKVMQKTIDQIRELAKQHPPILCAKGPGPDGKW